MTVNTDTIKKRLASVPVKQKDNEAQRIIKEAKPAELKALDVEGVLRLFEALTMLPPRVYSSNDKAAMRKLKAHTQFQPIVRTPHFGVDLVKKARLGSSIIQSQQLRDWSAVSMRRRRNVSPCRKGWVSTVPPSVGGRSGRMPMNTLKVRDTSRAR